MFGRLQTSDILSSHFIPAFFEPYRNNWFWNLNPMKILEPSVIGIDIFNQKSFRFRNHLKRGQT